jgi:hypothetical protein
VIRISSIKLDIETRKSPTIISKLLFVKWNFDASGAEITQRLSLTLEPLHEHIDVLKFFAFISIKEGAEKHRS